MTSPTDSSCTYTDATNLNKLVDLMNKCMTNPTATDCTTDYSATTTLPKVSQWINDLEDRQTVSQVLISLQIKVVNTLNTCMTDVTDSSCTSYPSTSSVPVIGKRKFQNFLLTINEFSIGKNVHLCMTNVDDSTCTSSYGTLLTSNPAGTGIVGYIQQLSKTTL